MRIIRDLSSVERSHFTSPAVTLGVFDGVHLGHRHLFRVLQKTAEQRGGEAVVVTFDRHPRGVVTGERPPTITSLEHRLVLFERAGLDCAVVLRFDEALMRTPADAFVRDILVGRLGARAIVLGEDAHFGKGRDGGLPLLEGLAPELGFELVPVTLLPVRAGGKRVSSTAVREAIAAGRLDEARAMLGRPVSLLGRVVRGAERGRTIGFPTANLELHQEVAPPRGVYAGRVEVDGVILPTMQNLGVRPTFEGEGEREVLEVHLIGYEGDLYGRVLDVEFVTRLRDERPFPSAAALKAQLALDREAALGAA